MMRMQLPKKNFPKHWQFHEYSIKILFKLFTAGFCFLTCKKSVAVGVSQFLDWRPKKERALGFSHSRISSWLLEASFKKDKVLIQSPSTFRPLTNRHPSVECPLVERAWWAVRSCSQSSLTASESRSGFFFFFLRVPTVFPLFKALFSGKMVH